MFHSSSLLLPSFLSLLLFPSLIVTLFRPVVESASQRFFREIPPALKISARKEQKLRGVSLLVVIKNDICLYCSAIVSVRNFIYSETKQVNSDNVSG